MARKIRNIVLLGMALEGLFHNLQQGVGDRATIKLAYAMDGNKPTNKRKKVKLARKANLNNRKYLK